MLDYPEMVASTEGPEVELKGLMRMSEEDRDELAQRLVRELDSWEIRRNALKPRWDKHEQLYQCDESATTLNTVEGISTYPVSLWRPKCDGAKGNVVGGLLSANPIVQCIEEGPDGTNEGPLEKALMQIAERSRFDRVFPLAVHTAFNTNSGVLRTRPTTNDKGEVDGIECDWFHPKHVCFYPAAVGRVSECRTVGHRFYQGLWDIEEKQREGVYYKYREEIVAGDDPDRDDKVPGRVDKVNQVGSTAVDVEDGFVECWEMVTRIRVGKEWKLALAVLARSSQKILSLQKYPYSRAWYDIVRPLQTEKKLLTNDSVAQGVQGYCLAAQDLMNAIVGGAYMTAYPVVWIRGWQGSNQATLVRPGGVIPLGPEGEMGVVGLPFDAQKFAGALEKFEGLVDTTVGMSRISSSQNLPSETKATAINALVAGDERRQATYLDACAEAVEGVFELLLEFLKNHHRELAKKYGGSVAAVNPSTLEKPYRLEVTGRSGASNPSTIVQKLQFLMTTAQNPQSTLDYSKVEDRAVDALDLPFDTSSLKKDWLSSITMMASAMKEKGLDPMEALYMGAEQLTNVQPVNPQGLLPDPGVGGVQGVPQEQEEPPPGGLDPMLPGEPEGETGGNSGDGPVPFGIPGI